MRAALISDLHLPLSTEGQIKQMLRALQKEKFDVLVNCGDNNGGSYGAKAVARVAKMVRQHLPDVPVLWTNSNHDRWCYSNRRVKVGDRYIKVSPGAEGYYQNLSEIRVSLKEHNIHYLDEDGIYSHEKFPNVVFIGSSGWYNNPRPPTNDANWLPIGLDGDTHRAILKETENDLFRAVDQLKDFDPTWQTLVFASHFPVIRDGNDSRGFDDFCWREGIAEFFMREYGCKHFLSGHSHRRKEGPVHFNCGSDYGNPKYLIIDI